MLLMLTDNTNLNIAKYKLGWVFIAILIINYAVNLGLVLILLVINAIT